MIYNINVYLKSINKRIEEIAKEVDYNVNKLNKEQLNEMAELSAMETALKKALANK